MSIQSLTLEYPFKTRQRRWDWRRTRLVIHVVSRMNGVPSSSSPVDGRTDLYSVGAVLFELLAGRPMFVDDDPLVLVQKHAFTTPPALRDVATRPDLTPEIELLVTESVAKKPDLRFACAASMSTAVDLAMRSLDDRADVMIAAWSTSSGRVAKPVKYERDAIEPTLDAKPLYVGTAPHASLRRRSIQVAIAGVAAIVVIGVVAANGDGKQQGPGIPVPSTGPSLTLTAADAQKESSAEILAHARAETSDRQFGAAITTVR